MHRRLNLSVTIMQGDARYLASIMADEVNCIVTSPPYWGLRDYGVDGQIGLEATPDEYVRALVALFRVLRDQLRDDGTLWLNLGDTYAAARSYQVRDNKHVEVGNNMASRVPAGLKSKDLVGIPWRIAFALQADGWWLRSDIIWSKPNPMPESVTDRPTKAHEYVFLFAKSERYYFDAAAVAEPSEHAGDQAGLCRGTKRRAYAMGRQPTGNEKLGMNWIQPATRNIRSVWTLVTEPFNEAHFATFPTELAKRCILAGCPKGGTVLDPFAGAGTTGLVADRLGRDFIGFELNPEYAEMAKRRIRNDAPLFAEVNE